VGGAGGERGEGEKQHEVITSPLEAPWAVTGRHLHHALGVDEIRRHLPASKPRSPRTSRNELGSGDWATRSASTTSDETPWPAAGHPLERKYRSYSTEASDAPVVGFRGVRRLFSWQRAGNEAECLRDIPDGIMPL
jgi:hypothetical protein